MGCYQDLFAKESRLLVRSGIRIPVMALHLVFGLHVVSAHLIVCGRIFILMSMAPFGTNVPQGIQVQGFVVHRPQVHDWSSMSLVFPCPVVYAVDPVHLSCIRSLQMLFP